jgi:Asp/Glu/hydantoin racemase
MRKRVLLIQPYTFAETSPLYAPPRDGSREARLINFEDYGHLLADLDWDVHPGPVGPFGDSFVETREEFATVGVLRLPIVREAAAGGRWDAIVLLGGGDPGFAEAREIGQRHDVPVVACAHAQMTVARMLGHRFSVIDVSEVHNMQMYNLVVQYRFTENCASVRCIDAPLPRPSRPGACNVQAEKAVVEAGRPSILLDRAVDEAVAAIEEDGAESIMLGCSAIYWMRPHIERRLADMGWEVPVLEGYRCAIEMAKLLANLGLSASGLAFPRDNSRRWRRRKTF